MLDSLAWIALAFTSVGLMVIAVGGRYALQMINEIYVPYLPELLVLSVGTATLGMARPATIMLLISGHEASYLRISAISVMMRVIGLFVFVPMFGVMGAVSTTAVCFAAQAIAVNQAARRMTHVDASMLRLLRLKAKP
jgi:O-antigen/teichoic acid export membrane protein